MLISELIVREELIGLLADLVTINRVNPAYDPASNEKKIADHIRAVLSDWRISVEIQEVFPDRCNVIARVEAKPQSGFRSPLSRGGIPSIVLGSNIDQAHSAVEYVDINQIVAATEIYTRIMVASQLESVT